MTIDSIDLKLTGPRLAILADIHGNTAALERVEQDIDEWQPDTVIVLGDVVTRGPRPVECLDRMLHRRDHDGWILMRGNHEEYVLQCESPPYGPDAPEYDVYRGAHWTYDKLSESHRTEIGTLPIVCNLRGPEGTRITATHASMTGLLEGIFPWSTTEEIRPLIDPTANFFVVAHTHSALDIVVDRTRVINVGSVGLPFDLDQRACYARFELQGDAWTAGLVRLDYDLERAERDFHTSGFLDEGGPLARLVLDELHSAESRLFQWMQKYFARVQAGEIDVQRAADEFLRDVRHSRSDDE